MFSLTEFLINKFVKQEREDTHEHRAALGSLEAWTSIYGNIILSILKFGFGFSLGSISLLADAVHTASDIVTSVVVLIGFRIAQIPPDDKHPFGHARAETTATLIISILLMLAGLTFAQTSVERLINPVVVKGSVFVGILMLLSGIVKEWMARFSICLGKRANSSALIADAWHHRSDAIASVLVALAIFLSSYGYYWVDSLFGIGVSLLIIYTGFELARDSVSSLLGEKPNPEMLKNIRSEVMNVDGVEDVHKIKVHDYGYGKKFVSLHILVDSKIDVTEAHDIASKAQDFIAERLGFETTIHIEPYLIEAEH